MFFSRGLRTVRGHNVETEELPAYCAVAMAGLGDLPDTIFTRAVIINMRRRAPGERVEAFRRRLEIEGGNALERATGMMNENSSLLLTTHSA